MNKYQRELFREAISGIHASPELENAVLSITEQDGKHVRTHRQVWKRIPVLAAAIVLILGLSVCVYAVTVSIREEMEKNWSQSLDAEAPQDIENMTLPEITVTDIKTGEETTVLQQTDAYWYRLLLEYGKVYQFEVYENENGSHDYRYIGTFSEEELQGAVLSPDCKWIEIDGSLYRLQLGWVQDIGSDADKEQIYRVEEEKTQLYDPAGDIRILRVYDAENWAELPGILADEGVNWIRDTVVKPLSEGRAAIYKIDTDGKTEFYKGEDVYSEVVFDRMVTEDEIENAEVSLDGYQIMIDGERYYHVNDDLDEDGNVQQLHLIPADSYYVMQWMKMQEMEMEIEDSEETGYDNFSYFASQDVFFHSVNEWLEAGK